MFLGLRSQINVLKLRGQFAGLLFVMQLRQQVGEACNIKYTLKGNSKYNRFLTLLGMQDKFSPANIQLSFHEKSSSVTLRTLYNLAAQTISKAKQVLKI